MEASAPPITVGRSTARRNEFATPDARRNGRWEAPNPIVSVLDLDPELAAVLPSDVLPMVRQRTLARVQQIDVGPWTYQPLGDPAAFGFLVIDGLLGARIAIGEEACVEVLGEGDLLRPWVREEESSVPAEVGWVAFDRTRVAVLDERFANGVAPWPEIAGSLMQRLVLRARRLSFQLALAGIERTEERILIALWHFADRWGQVTPDGVVVHLPLTQTALGEVVRAARQTISSALSDLRRRGEISFERTSHRWTLHGEPPALVHDLKRQVGLP